MDDKAAKTLLGQSFKRQLKLDGTISTVTFICSKTDDISLLEASDALDLGDELGDLWAKIDDCGKSIKASKMQIADLKVSKGVYSELMDDAEEHIDVWDSLRNELGNGKTVFAPEAKSSKKRKAKTSRQSAKKRRAQSNSDIDDSEDEDFGDDESSDGSEVAEGIRDPLTEETISQKISEFKANKKKARQEKSQLDSTIKALAVIITTKQVRHFQNLASPRRNVLKQGVWTSPYQSPGCKSGRGAHLGSDVQADETQRMSTFIRFLVIRFSHRTRKTYSRANIATMTG